MFTLLAPDAGRSTRDRRAYIRKPMLGHRLASLRHIHWITWLMLALPVSPSQANHAPHDEPYNTGWSVQIDNDLFASGGRDQDYTGGFIVTQSGRRAAQYRATPNAARQWIDTKTGIDAWLHTQPHRTRHALEWGAALFTPVDIKASELSTEDRPYASLFFLNSTALHIQPKARRSIKTELTFGLLGLQLADTLQSRIHGALGNTKPQGWRHQVSRGGEVTFKYSVGVQDAAYQAHYKNGLAQEFNWTRNLDIGFTTGFGAGFNWRYGRINTPWWSFNPHQSDYVNLGANISPTVGRPKRVQERYIYAGGALRYNVYNAFVQGQFRDSAFTVDRDDIVPGTAEVWIGGSIETRSKSRIDAFVRARTKELKLRDSVSLLWGGFTYSRFI